MGCLHPKKIADYQKGRLVGGARAKVEQHLKECATCRTVHLRTENALLALKEIGEGGLPVPALSSARIEATLRWTRSNRSLDPVRLWGIGLGLTAAAACALLVFAWHPWRKASVVTAPVIATAPQQPVVAPAPKSMSLSALITLVGGEAQIARGDAAAQQANPKTPLAAGDLLTTSADGRIGLQWGEGSGALLAQKSSLKLAQLEPKAQSFELSRGQVSVRVGPHQPGEALSVLSPYHTITVHGTWFVVAADAKGTTIEVLEGVVEVSAREGDGSSTKIAAPQRAFFPRGQGVAANARALSGREAAALRTANEIGLLPSWSTLDHAMEITGILGVTSTPPAQLVVDGVAFGQTPLGLRRAHGRHLVELTRPGFATISRWVNVGNEPGELRLALEKDAVLPDITAPDISEIQAVLKLRAKHYGACYDHALKLNPDLAGTATVTIKIGPAGQVLNTSFADDTIGTLQTCLKHEIAGWSFDHARNVTVEIPLIFRPQ
jgi:hypothetical protein